MALNYQYTESLESKMRIPDRILKLEVIDGKKPINSLGLVDPRLFKEGAEANRLHIVMDLETSLWSIKYDKGQVPPVLQGRFTGFKQAFEHAKTYFLNRNVNIVQVKD